MYQTILVPVDGSKRAEAILNIAAETGADLVAMATHGLSGLSRVSDGSVAAGRRSRPARLHDNHRSVQFLFDCWPSISGRSVGTGPGGRRNPDQPGRPHQSCGPGRQAIRQTRGGRGIGAEH